MEFDKSKILTAVTADQAKVGDMGWLSDTLTGIRAKVERGDTPEEIVRVLPDDYIHRFKIENNAYMLFYPAPYEFLQDLWVKENSIKVGDKVMVMKKWENGPKGSGYEKSILVEKGDVFKITEIESGCLVCSGKAFHCNVDTGWRLPFFAIEKVKEEYRPFANAEEFRPHREKWFSSKFQFPVTTRAVSFGVEGLVLGSGDDVDYGELFKDYTFEDGTPAGVKV